MIALRWLVDFIADRAATASELAALRDSNVEQARTIAGLAARAASAERELDTLRSALASSMAWGSRQAADAQEWRDAWCDLLAETEQERS